MREGLEAVRNLSALTIGTITLDSFTRVGDLRSAERAVELGQELNGYPIVAHGREGNRELLSGLLSADFPVQVRHGSPQPDAIFGALIDAGLDATEGGPISYCLPYSRVPLNQAVTSWGSCCRMLASLEEEGTVAHLESFGGCMLGQLCPPSLLLAIGVLEGLFFREHGLHSISLSYAQGSNREQDIGAILALRQLAARFLSGTSWHVVVYCFMGLFPRTLAGARRLLEESVHIAVSAGAERLIVKTASEAHQIPSIAQNIEALQWAQQAGIQALDAEHASSTARENWHRDVLYVQALSLVEQVLDLSSSIGECMEIAFRKGYLDVPYCLHPDNKNRARSWVDGDGTIHWADTGDISFPKHLRETIFRKNRVVTSSDLAQMLAFNQNKYDFGLQC
jgi:methylaspartate mutase epsilon subunit